MSRPSAGRPRAPADDRRRLQRSAAARPGRLGSPDHGFFDLDRVIVLIDECKRMGLSLLPPDINESQAEFTVTPKGVRFGLRAIKNVGQAAIEGVMAERADNGAFKDLYEFCRRVDLRKLNRQPCLRAFRRRRRQL